MLPYLYIDFEKLIFCLFDCSVALHKEATLSSQYDSDHKSSNSVDGITTCHYVAASTYSTTDPWLLIDLEKTYDIRMVVVYARKVSPGMQIHIPQHLCIEMIFVYSDIFVWYLIAVHPTLSHHGEHLNFDFFRSCCT